jgi:hypothetical protein
MKTAVDAIFVGKERAYNRRFQQMCGHYLVDPVACTPASGWEKGQVENQVGTSASGLFSPRVRVKSLASSTTGWSTDASNGRRPAPPGDRRQDDLGGLRGGAGQPRALSRALRRLPRDPGGGVQDLPRAVRQQQVLGRGQRRRPPGGDAGLCRPDRDAPGGPRRRRARPRLRPGRTVYDPWHYVPVLARKPGALRNGAPFKDWVLPAPIERVRRKLRAAPDGDRQMVEILGAALTDGLPGGGGRLRRGA